MYFLGRRRRQCHEMSACREGKEQIARYVVPLANRTSDRMCHRLNNIPDVVPAHTQAPRAECSSKMLSQHAGMFREALWPHMHPVEVTRVRVTAKEFNDAKKVRTTRRALLVSSSEHEARDRPDRTRTREH